MAHEANNAAPVLSAAMQTALDYEQSDAIGDECMQLLNRSLSAALYENYLKEKELQYSAVKCLTDVLSVVEVCMLLFHCVCALCFAD